MQPERSADNKKVSGEKAESDPAQVYQTKEQAEREEDVTKIAKATSVEVAQQMRKLNM